MFFTCSSTARHFHCCPVEVDLPQCVTCAMSLKKEQLC